MQQVEHASLLHQLAGSAGGAGGEGGKDSEGGEGDERAGGSEVNVTRMLLDKKVRLEALAVLHARRTYGHGLGNCSKCWLHPAHEWRVPLHARWKWRRRRLYAASCLEFGRSGSWRARSTLWKGG